MLTNCAEPQQISEADSAFSLLYDHGGHRDAVTRGPCMAYVAAVAAATADFGEDE